MLGEGEGGGEGLLRKEELEGGVDFNGLQTWKRKNSLLTGTWSQER